MPSKKQNFVHVWLNQKLSWEMKSFCTENTFAFLKRFLWVNRTRDGKTFVREPNRSLIQQLTLKEMRNKQNHSSLSLGKCEWFQHRKMGQIWTKINILGKSFYLSEKIPSNRKFCRQKKKLIISAAKWAENYSKVNITFNFHRRTKSYKVS